MYPASHLTHIFDSLSMTMVRGVKTRSSFHAESIHRFRSRDRETHVLLGRKRAAARRSCLLGVCFSLSVLLSLSPFHRDHRRGDRCESPTTFRTPKASANRLYLAPTHHGCSAAIRWEEVLAARLEGRKRLWKGEERKRKFDLLAVIRASSCQAISL